MEALEFYNCRHLISHSCILSLSQWFFSIFVLYCATKGTSLAQLLSYFTIISVMLEVNFLSVDELPNAHDWSIFFSMHLVFRRFDWISHFNNNVLKTYQVYISPLHKGYTGFKLRRSQIESPLCSQHCNNVTKYGPKF